MAVSRQRPARDRAYERMLIVELIKKIRNELRQVRRHAIYAALRDGAEREDAAFAHLKA